MKRLSLSIISSLIAVVSMVIFVKTFVHAEIGAPDSSREAPSATSSDYVVTDLSDDMAPIDASTTIAISTTTSTSTAESETKHVVVVHPTYPARLTIPSLNINAYVQQVGINAKGAIGVPSNFIDVAWYKYSAVPGENGDAVIDGHVDNGLALAGVFKHISNIKPGDEIDVTREDGMKVTFIVNTVNSYNYKDVSMETILHSSTNSAHLWLITCGGTWVPDDRTYDQRIFIDAVMK